MNKDSGRVYETLSSSSAAEAASRILLASLGEMPEKSREAGKHSTGLV